MKTNRPEGDLGRENSALNSDIVARVPHLQESVSAGTGIGTGKRGARNGWVARCARPSFEQDKAVRWGRLKTELLFSVARS